MGNKISKKRMARSSGHVPMHYATGVSSHTDYPGVSSTATTTTTTTHIPPPPPVSSHSMGNAPPVNIHSYNRNPPPPPLPPRPAEQRNSMDHPRTRSFEDRAERNRAWLQQNQPQELLLNYILNAAAYQSRSHPMLPVYPVEDTPAIIFTNRTNPRPYRQNRRQLERQLAEMEQMGVPPELQRQILANNGDMSEEAFNQLVILVDAIAGGRPQERTREPRVPPARRATLESLPVVEWKSSLEESIGAQCNICLEEFQENEQLVRLPNCLHSFHRQCIRTWLTQKAQCPVCRSAVE